MKKIFVRIGIGILISGLVAALGITVFLFVVAKRVDYTVDEELFRKAAEESTTYYYAYNRDNELVEVWKSFSNGRREWVSISDVNEVLVKGFLAVEDRQFYSHKGINLKRTVAAIANYILKFRDAFGASTITQQVVKNISGDNETTVKRKVNELLRAVHLERNHSKEEILELYLNIVPMSENMYGVSVASEAYFGKESSDLTVAESATIIGITNAPALYSPYSNPESCLIKRNRVLAIMRETGIITDAEYSEAVSSPLGVNTHPQLPGISSWFIETAHQEIVNDLTQKYSISEPAAKLMLNGARIVLTMVPEIQDILDDFFSDTTNLSEKFNDGLNYSMVVSDPKTGNLLGIVGNGGEKKGERLYNYATAPITPGSTIKPLSIYAPLIDSAKINWTTIVSDTPVRYQNTSEEVVPYPKNTPDVYEGDITVADALKKSKNTVAVRLLQEYGIDNAFKLLNQAFKFNLSDKFVRADGTVITDRSEAPLALGQLTQGVSLKKLTESYNVFPNEGILAVGGSYYGVFDRNGNTVIEKNHEERAIFRSDTSKIVNQLLSNVVKDGTARQITLKESVDTAGKTGTSGKDRDRLFIGYTPYYTAGIWCGFSNGKAIGNNIPNHLNIWDEVMKRIHNKMVFDKYSESTESFDISGLVVQPYCSSSGGSPNEYCELDDEAIIEYGYYSTRDMLNKECDKH